MGDDFDDGGMELVGVIGGSRASFEITHIGVVLGDEEGALKLSGALIIKAKIGGELQWAADAFWNKGKGAIRENSGIESGKKVVCDGDNRAKIFFYKIGVGVYSF